MQKKLPHAYEWQKNLFSLEEDNSHREISRISWIIQICLTSSKSFRRVHNSEEVHNYYAFAQQLTSTQGINISNYNWKWFFKNQDYVLLTTYPKIPSVFPKYLWISDCWDNDSWNNFGNPQWALIYHNKWCPSTRGISTLSEKWHMPLKLYRYF